MRAVVEIDEEIHVAVRRLLAANHAPEETDVARVVARGDGEYRVSVREHQSPERRSGGEGPFHALHSTNRLLHEGYSEDL